ncbi:hypothetical protein GCM10007978_36950 [Shewanella hanedai]|nr:hypothetical protein GCM10007978_36950 [Shewanella hanedai]
MEAAASFDFRTKLHQLQLFEREVGMPNWQFNKEVIGNRKAAMEGFIAARRSICTYAHRR